MYIHFDKVVFLVPTGHLLFINFCVFLSAFPYISIQAIPGPMALLFLFIPFIPYVGVSLGFCVRWCIVQYGPLRAIGQK